MNQGDTGSCSHASALTEPLKDHSSPFTVCLFVFNNYVCDQTSGFLGLQLIVAPPLILVSPLVCNCVLWDTMLVG